AAPPSWSPARTRSRCRNSSPRAGVGGFRWSATSIRPSRRTWAIAIAATTSSTRPWAAGIRASRSSGATATGFCAYPTPTLVRSTVSAWSTTCSTSSPAPTRTGTPSTATPEVARLAGEAFEGRDAVGDVVEALLVRRLDGDARAAEHTRLVQGAHLQDHARKAMGAGQDVGAAGGAEFALGRMLQVSAGEGLWCPPGVGEPLRRHAHHHI